jgi:UDP-3-O-[3-hydroxymyristoyl] glucosamine N-acyltransferase
VSQAGISGSTVLEDFVMAGGQAGITGHLRLGKGAKIGAQAGVMADVPAGAAVLGAAVLGSPALPIREFFRQVTVLKRLVAERRSQVGKGGPSGEVDSD